MIDKRSRENPRIKEMRDVRPKEDKYTESELVAGFQTEHSALSFAYFFIGEYGNIILICTITANLFLGGYSIFGINSAIILGVKVSILLFVFI